MTEIRPQAGSPLTLVGLCLFTFAVVTYRLPVGEIGAAIAVLGLVLQRGKLRVPFPLWLFGAFVLWAFVAAQESRYPEIALDRVVDLLKLFVIMLVIANALQTTGQLRFYLLFFLGCFVLFPVRGTLVGGDTVVGRAVWNYIYSNPNELAALSLVTLGVAVGALFTSTYRVAVRVGAGLSAILLLVVILLTQSRGVFIGMMVGMSPAIIGFGLKRPVRLVLSAGVVVLIISIAIPTSVWERLSGIEKLTSESTIAQADPEGSAEERFEIQKIAWQVFLDNPAFGVGLGAYPSENAKYSPKIGRKDAHNTYLSLATEVGLPGVLLWCALVLSILRYAYRSRKRAGARPMSTQQAWVERAFWGYLVAGIFGSYAALTFPYLMLTVLWCSATLLGSPIAEAENAGGTSEE